MQVETMRMNSGNGPIAVPHTVPSHGIAVKQEPSDERLKPLFPAAGGRPVPPLPSRRVPSYRFPGPLPSSMASIRLTRKDGTPIVQGGTPAAFNPPAPAPVVKVETPVQNSGTRICAAMDCMFVLQMDYPHLRCRTCRSLNVPRRPELSTILTPAQLLARDRRRQGVPPLPSRVGAHMHLGRGPPPLPYRPPPFPSPIQLPHAPQISPIPTMMIPASASPFCAVPPAASCKADPDLEADRALQALLKPSSDDDADDTDTIDLTCPEDLSYPESGNVTPIDAKPPPFPPSPFDNPANPLSLSAIPHPAHKRRKVSHSHQSDPPESSDAIAATHPPQLQAPPLPSRSTAKPHLPAPPLPIRRPLSSHPNAAASSSTAKPCSEADCQNHIPAVSPATRCMSCISKAWKSKRFQSVTPTRLENDGRRRGVTWADENDREQEHDEFDLRKAVQSHEATNSPGSKTANLSPTEDEAVEGWDSDLTELSQSDSEGGSSAGGDGEGGGGEGEGGDDSGNEVSEPEIPSAPVPSGLKIRIPPRSGTKPEDASRILVEHRPSSPSFTSPLTSTTASHPPPTSSPTPTPDDRGDSSPIALSTPTTTPDVESESLQETDNASGSRICAQPRCKRTLPASYHWKTCVVCRASARGYQRRRQNLQGRHMQLDFELEEHLKQHGNSGDEEDADKTPSPLQTRVRLLMSGPKAQGDGVRQAPKPPPVKVDIEPFDDDDTSYNLTSGARVCSVKDCSHVVPSPEEYPWKLCIKCRSRSKENSKLRSGRGSASNQPAAKEYRHEVVGPEALAMKRSDGRCLSSDCGMLVSAESKYPYCRQCRLQDWRLKRRDLRKQAILEAERSKTPSSSSGSSTPLSIRIPAMRARAKLQRAPVQPRPPTPYPEYKNLASLLANFRILAKNFFDAQTMHFAHQSPDSAPSLSIFIFDGEFTLVAPDLHVAQKRKAQVDRTVAMIQREVGAAARLQYAEKKWLTMFNQGIVSRYVCWREPVRVRVPLPVTIGVAKKGAETRRESSGKAQDLKEGNKANESDKETGKPEGETEEQAAAQAEPARYILKEVLSYHHIMEGELEVAVFADKSHPFIPGERTVVRVRLVG